MCNDGKADTRDVEIQINTAFEDASHHDQPPDNPYGYSMDHSTIEVRVNHTGAGRACAGVDLTNMQATGRPTISGTPQVGEKLTAHTDQIMDADGLDMVSYNYQWKRESGGSYFDISGKTGDSYEITSADEGKRLRVQVSFNDNENNLETLWSSPTISIPSDDDNGNGGDGNGNNGNNGNNGSNGGGGGGNPIVVDPPTSTPTPTPTMTPSPTPTATATPTPVPTNTPTPTPTPDNRDRRFSVVGEVDSSTTKSDGPVEWEGKAFDPSVGTPTITPTPTVTPSPTPTPTATPTPTPSPTPTPTPTPTATPTLTPSPTPQPTPDLLATAQAGVGAAATPTPTPTSTPTPTPLPAAAPAPPPPSLEEPGLPVIGNAIPRVRNALDQAAAAGRDRWPLVILLVIVLIVAGLVFVYLILRRR